MGRHGGRLRPRLPQFGRRLTTCAPTPLLRATWYEAVEDVGTRCQHRFVRGSRAVRELLAGAAEERVIDRFVTRGDLIPAESFCVSTTCGRWGKRIRSRDRAAKTLREGRNVSGRDEQGAIESADRFG